MNPAFNTQKQYKILRIVERISGFIALAWLVMSSVWSLSLGAFFFLGVLASVMSPVGILGVLALLIWAVTKSVRLLREDKKAFLNPKLNGAQIATLVVLGCIVSLMAITLF